MPVRGRRGEQAEVAVAAVEQLVGIAVAQPQGQLAARLPGRAEAVHGLVVPAETGAVAVAGRARGTAHAGIAERLDLAPENALHVRRQRPVATLPAQAQAVVGRHVQVAAFGQQLVEALHLLHVATTGVAGAEAQLVAETPQVTQAQAGAIGLVAPLRQADAGRAVDVQLLADEHDAQAQAVAGIELAGVAEGGDHLLELGPGALQAADIAVSAVGGADAVADDRQAQAADLVEHVVGAQLGNDVEVVVLAAADGLAGELDAVVDLEQGHPGIHAVAHPGHAGRVGGPHQGILGQRQDHPGHAFGLDPVAMREGALGGLGQRGGAEQQGRAGRCAVAAQSVVLHLRPPAPGRNRL
ncbi:hypothetical protein FQZ97_699310 [compost metagenome]